jgi:hypothetical protein
MQYAQISLNYFTLFKYTRQYAAKDTNWCELFEFIAVENKILWQESSNIMGKSLKLKNILLVIDR